MTKKTIIALWLGKRLVFSIILIIISLTIVAQTDDTRPKRESQKWAVDGLIMWLSPRLDYYDKNLERYNPPVPMVWFGSSCLNSNKTGDVQKQFPLQSGVFNKLDYGFTILQISRNLYRGTIGLSAGLQFGKYSYKVSHKYHAIKDKHRVEFVPADDEHESNNISFNMLRIPLLIGAQTNNRLWSLQTGVGIYHASRPGCQWLVTAGLGPFTINYSQNITPLFKLGDGTKAYPYSITIGVDMWYWLCRFPHQKSEGQNRPR